MNFLAHLYLSGDNDELKIGNFIGDHVKGNQINLLPDGIRKGVLLHRKIDFFTDQHPVVMKSKERLRPRFRKYAPVVADIFYDHFLAAGWNRYSSISLEKFSEDFFVLVKTYSDFLPDRTKKMLPYMIVNNWLVSYATLYGIHNVFKGMAQRTAFVSGMENAVEELKLNYESYENEFRIFFTDLEQYVLEQRKEMLLS